MKGLTFEQKRAAEAIRPERRKEMNNRPGIFFTVSVCTALLLACSHGHAATVSQTLTLKSGWNAVFLEVHPADPDPAAVFAGVSDLQSVWAWNSLSSPVEYIQNPGLLLPDDPYMLAWFPGQPQITTLSTIRGGTSYLVSVGGTGSQTWTVTGQPAVPKSRWKADSFNLVGFHLDPGQAPPLFFDFFSSSPAHAGQEIFVLDNASGAWVEVTSPSTSMQAGESFWIFCKGSSTFTGPFGVQLEQSTGLNFGNALVEQEVVLRNVSSTDRTISLRASSAAAQLHYWKFSPDITGGEWVNLHASSPPLDVPVSAGAEQRIRLGVSRAGLAAGALYESNVVISDGSGVRFLLPASVEGIGTAGLWVGDVIADKVRYNASGTGTKTPVGSPFGFRIILHVDDGGQVRLLREVVQLWQEGTWKADPDNLGREVVDQPGSFVLVANRARLGEFRGAALRDGQEVGRRVSTAAFGFSSPVAAESGSSFALGESVRFIVGTSASSVVNPFLHQYHKGHSASESYDITRDITLDFGEYDGEGNLVTGVPILSWGSTTVGGVFSEVLSLTRAEGSDAPYEVEIGGTFRLRRVSDVSQLQL